MTGGRDAQQLERLTFFSDAVFAIAMTLLVIEVRLPVLHGVSEAGLGHALLSLYPNYIGFIASFLVIGRFWVAHHRLMGMLDRHDEALVWANLLFLLAVAFMPFPTAVFSEYVGLRVGVGLYAGWLVLLGLLNHRLFRLALGNDRLVRPGIDAGTRRLQVRVSWAPVLIGGIAFVLGMVWPPLSVVGLFFGSPLFNRLMRGGQVAPTG